MAFVAAWVLVLSALPALSAPELLVDVDDSPSGVAEIVATNANGAIYELESKDATRSLWWISWAGSPFLVATRRAGDQRPVQATTLGNGFVILLPEEGGTRVLALSLDAEPRLETLGVAPESVTLLHPSSSTQTWWFDARGASSTDGTLAGTALRAPGFIPVLEAGGELYGDDQGQLTRWNGGAIQTTRLPISGIRRAGSHVVAADGSMFNELGEELVAGRLCMPLAGGDHAWFSCVAADGGVTTFATDGTPGGTEPRLGPFGNFIISPDMTSSDYALSRFGTAQDTVGSGCVLVPAVGPQVVFPGVCQGRILGDVLVGNFLASSLVPPFESVALDDRYWFGKQAGRKVLFPAPRNFRLSDGRESGTITVPARWPDSMTTRSSAPHLLTSDGDRALYATTRGVWVTDGSAAGTFRAGDEAVLWGKSVLTIAAATGAGTVFDARGESWVAPDGAVTAHGRLVVRSGCGLFTVDENRQRKVLQITGCAESITPGVGAALIATSEGDFFLVRDEQSFALGRDVWPGSTVRCAEKRCWVLGSPTSGFITTRVLELESKSVETRPTVAHAPESQVTLLGASDVAAISHSADSPELFGSRGSLVVNSLDAGALAFELQSRWHFVRDGRVLVLTSAGLSVIPGGPQDALSFACGVPLGVSAAGGQVHALCDELGERVLRSGTLAGGLEKVDAGFPPILPEGEEVAWTTVLTTDGKPALRAWAGAESREFENVYGSEFARVKHGFVFSGSGPAIDAELWVMRTPSQGCGCGNEGGLMAAFAVLVLLRRQRQA